MMSWQASVLNRALDWGRDGSLSIAEASDDWAGQRRVPLPSHRTASHKQVMRREKGKHLRDIHAVS